MKKRIAAFMIAAMIILSCGHTAMAAKNDWGIVNGYGSVINTGNGIRTEGDNTVFNGYGGACYLPQAIHEAVAVEFEIIAYPPSTHYFNFGLLDTQNVFWDTSGKLAKGIMARASISTDGNTLQATGLNITGETLGTIDAIKSPLKPVGVSHMFVMYRDGDHWVYSLDGTVSNTIPVASAKLGNTSYLSVGSYGRSTMEMAISKVYIDGEVTAEMKDGTYIIGIAGDEGANNVYYDDDNRLVMGETVKNSALSYIEPSYLVNEMGGNQKPDMVVYILGGSAVVTLTISIFIFVTEIRKQKKYKNRKGADVYGEKE